MPKVEELAAALRDILRPGDVVLAMGAGNISSVAHDLPGQLARFAAETLAAGAASAPAAGAATGAGGSAQGTYPFVDRRRK